MGVLNSLQSISATKMWNSATDSVMAASGPNGTIRADLSKLPGFDIWITIWVIFLATVFIFEGKKFMSGDGTAKTAVAMFLLSMGVAGSSLIWFGNATTSIMILMLVGMGIYFFKHKGDLKVYGSHDEKQFQKQAGLNPNQEDKIINQETKQIHQDEKDEKHTKGTKEEKKEEKTVAKVEEDLDTEVRDNASEQFHMASIAAEADLLSSNLEIFMKDEVTIEEKSEAITKAIENYANILDHVDLKGNRVDERVTQYFGQVLDATMQGLEKYESAEKYFDTHVDKLLSFMDKAIKTLKMSVKEAQKLNAATQKFENKLSKVESKEVNNLLQYMAELKKTWQEERAKMATQINELRKMGNQQAAIDDINKQLKRWDEELKKEQEQSNSLMSINSELKKVLATQKQALLKVKQDLKYVMDQEADVERIEGQNNNWSKEFDKSLSSYIKQTNNVINSSNALKNNKITNPAKLAVFGTNTSIMISTVFSELKSLKGMTIRFEKGDLSKKEGVYPFMVSMIELLKKANQAEDSLQMQARAYYRIVQSFQGLDQMIVQFMNAQEITTDMKKEFLRAQNDQLVIRHEVAQGEKIKTLFKKAYNDMVEAEKEMQKHIGHLEDDFNNTEVTQARVLKILNGIIEAYSKKRNEMLNTAQDLGKTVLATATEAQKDEKLAKSEAKGKESFSFSTMGKM